MMKRLKKLTVHYNSQETRLQIGQTFRIRRKIELFNVLKGFSLIRFCLLVEII